MMSEHVLIPLIHTEESLFAVIAKLSESVNFFRQRGRRQSHLEIQIYQRGCG